MNSSRSKKRTFAAVLLPVILLSVAACGSSDSGDGSTSGGASPSGADALQTAAEAEGQFTWYTAYSADVVDAVAEAWAEKYPQIEMHQILLSTSELLTRFGAETTSGAYTADVLTASDKSTMESNPEWFVSLNEDELPNLSQWTNWADGDKYLNTNLTVQVFHYNTDNVSEDEIPKTWEDIIDPRWKGNAIMVDPRTGPSTMQWAKMTRDAYGDDFLRKVAEQNFALAEGGVPGTQEVAAGGADLIFPNFVGHSKGLRADGAPVAYAMVTEPPYPATAQYLGIPESAPYPSAARFFANWLISKEGQEIACLDVYGSVHPQAEGCLEVPSEGVSAEVPTGAEAEEILALLGFN